MNKIFLFREKSLPDKSVSIVLLLWLALVIPTTVFSGPREQAKRIHDRLAGVPPTETILDTMADLVDPSKPGTATDAADIAMENPAFYNITLKNFVTPWTNREQTVFASLNDYTATVIGMIRDGVPFNQLLSANILYVGNANLGLPAYSLSNNNHYQSMENQGIDLKAGLVQTQQALPDAATAGVMTTRAAAKSFFIAGTNRAMFRFTLLNHLCNDLEQVKDITRAPDRIRQDVSRSPGGDSRIFLNSCIGCHSGMDPMAQSFAHYNYTYDSNADPEGINGTLVYDNSKVQDKYLINSDNFKYGYVTTSDRWDNYWRSGQNALLGWSGSLTGTGNGAKSMGEELANSDAFAGCQVKKVFKTVCLREPGDQNDRDKVSSVVQTFKNNYNMKQVFAETANYCKGD